MMLKKQKRYLLFSLLFLFSCNEEKLSRFDKDMQLEYLLDTYISNKKGNTNSYIYINENQYWSDTTSIISISLIGGKINNKNVKSSIYRNNKIIYLLSSFRNQINIKNKISNKLKWKKIFKNDSKLINSSSEYEMQFIYNVNNRCISKVLLSFPINDSVVLKDINKCLCSE